MLDGIGRGAHPYLLNLTMQMSECCDPFRRRRIVNFKRRFSSEGEEEIEAENKSREQGPDRSGDTALSFLGCANFSPGRIDGRYTDFTLEAVALYRESRGEQPQDPPRHSGTNANVPPDVSGLELSRVEPVFVPYTATEADLQSVGQLPSHLAEQAKMKFLPYHDVADAIAEKFHNDIHFLEQLNARKLKGLKVGDQLKVPNVEPFELASVKEIQPGSETASQVANEVEDQPQTQALTPAQSAAPRNVSTKADTKTNMLGVFEAGKLIAACPVTIGSAHTASPIGEWKVRGIAKLPRFRYDKQMLEHGKRSGNSYMRPPGPRNPVGVTWVALNKKASAFTARTIPLRSDAL
jgi:lipoprotein-anchoring transpeptidase ErfK/SrfK